MKLFYRELISLKLFSPRRNQTLPWIILNFVVIRGGVGDSELSTWMSYRQKLCATGVKMVKILSVGHFIVNRLFQRKFWVLVALELLFQHFWGLFQ